MMAARPDAKMITLGVFPAQFEALQRRFPSPFQKLDENGEQLVQQHLAAARKRAAGGRAVVASATSAPSTLDGGLQLGTLHVRAADVASGERDALHGWSSTHIVPTVPFARVLHVVDRCARFAVQRTDYLPPRGLTNIANTCFACSILQLLFHCEPLRSWLEQCKVSASFGVWRCARIAATTTRVRGLDDGRAGERAGAAANRRRLGHAELPLDSMCRFVVGLFRGLCVVWRACACACNPHSAARRRRVGAEPGQDERARIGARTVRRA